MPFLMRQTISALMRPASSTTRGCQCSRTDGDKNGKAALASVGASFEHLVKLNNYIVDIGTNIALYREVRDKYVNKVSPPASTTVGVPASAPRRSIRGRSHRDITAKMTPLCLLFALPVRF